MTKEEKLGFIRKVYGILATQLLITAFMTLLPYVSEGLRTWLLGHQWLALVFGIVGIALSCTLFCVQSLARQVPTNYYLMFAFTVCEAYIVMQVCAIVNDMQTVIAATFMTAGIVVGLTFYALTTKRDFTAYGGLLFAVGAAFLMFGLFSVFFGFAARLVYCLLGVILFSVYLVFDTQYIIGGNGRYSLSREDYILGAVILYLDIINIFLYIVQILAALKD